MSSDHKSQLNDALFRILEPLAHLCIRQQVSNSELEEMIRLAFVQAAQSRKNDSEAEINNTRIGVLTGLNRKEVSRLKAILKDRPRLVEITPSRAQKVVNGWLKDAEFLDSKNKPRHLLIRNKKDGVEYGSFAALANRYGCDLRYLGILQELMIARVIEYVDDDTVALVNHAYIPYEDDIEKIKLLAKSVSDLFNTALHNIESKEDKRIQRQVMYSRIDEEYVEDLRDYINTNSQDFLELLNAELANKKNLSKRRTNTRKKAIGFGIYYVEKELIEKNE